MSVSKILASCLTSMLCIFNDLTLRREIVTTFAIILVFSQSFIFFVNCGVCLCMSSLDLSQDVNAINRC